MKKWVLILLSFGGLLSSLANANQDIPQQYYFDEEAVYEEQPCTKEVLPLEKASQIAAAVICQLEGKVLKVDKIEDASPTKYKVRWLKERRVKNLTVDGQTGLIIKD